MCSSDLIEIMLCSMRRDGNVLLVALLSITMAACKSTAPLPAAAPAQAKPTDQDLMDVSVQQLRQFYKARTFTVTDVVQWHLDRIDRYNSVYGAIETVLREQAKADALRDVADAVNLTESHAARMAMDPTAVGHLLLDRGVEPIVQMTARHRNRIAIQASLLGAAAHGIANFVFMGGDPPSNGDNPQAKPVFDLYAAQLIEAARCLQAGHDLAGNALTGTPRFCVGAVVNSGAAERLFAGAQNDHCYQRQRPIERSQRHQSGALH